MTGPDTEERTAGGLIGTVVGKAKTIVGDVLGDDDMAREGRLQQAQVDADAEARNQAAEARRAEEQAEVAAKSARLEAERRELQNAVAASERDAAAEGDRRTAELAAEQDEQRATEASADRVDHAAEQRGKAAVETARLKAAATQLEARADAIDPEETHS